MTSSNASLRRSFEVNALAHFWTIRAFLPQMICAPEVRERLRETQRDSERLRATQSDSERLREREPQPILDSISKHTLTHTHIHTHTHTHTHTHATK